MIRTRGSSRLTLILNGWFSHGMRGKCGLYLGCSVVLLADDSKAVALYCVLLAAYLSDRESLIMCTRSEMREMPP